MARKGLGKGLDSLIPDYYNEDFDSNSTQSLEDLLNENEESSIEEKTIFEQIEEEDDQENTEDSAASSVSEEPVPQEEVQVAVSESENLSGDSSSEETVQTSQEIKIQEEHVAEVKEIVDKNPRITLWSSRSSAVFRYLRKTEPEFSISKEASLLIEEAVAKKYPEIWALFDDY
ncbi:MAG: AAA family ATPase [Methanobrevibacter sp.]|uniref:AAA family ATPase n=1 Tax=Methanobrevibacter sp. TaxID=66852 RepID=UPI0025EC1320|nr:AAA family ATPase [Methanobrevibacter sp.]MBE6508428.1 AAA family ATPase [Methanobrevibacter sp.]